MYKISKTRYCKGIQCPKMLWLDEHKPELAENVLNETVMANGNKVGELARGYFGDYALVSLNDDKKAMTDETQRYMDDGWDNIAEASFTYDNMHDLMLPFQKRYYYSAAMNGSYSIKYVLPALWPGDPELDYHNLDGVHNGMEASAAFASMAEHTPDEIADIRANLLKYCGLDTYAMVKVLWKLRSVCPSTNSPTKP